MKKLIALFLLFALVPLGAVHAEEPLTISIVCTSTASWGDPADNKLIAAIEEAANVKLDIEVVPMSSLSERLNLIMASGSLPDLINCSGGESMWNWVESGLILPIDEYLANAPHVTAMVPEATFNVTKNIKDGHLYGIPVANPVLIPGMYWRQDWLDAVGLPVPETLEDCVAAWTAFTTQDPDGNGKDDTYGLTLTTPSTGLNCSGALFPALGVPGTLTGSWCLVDGQAVYSIFHPNYVSAVSTLAEWYADGIIEPEFVLNKTRGDVDLKFNTGLVGCSVEAIMRSSWVRLVENTETAQEGAAVIATGAPGGSVADLTGYLGIWLMTSAVENPERIMDFLDLMHTEEWWFKQSNGLEGAHYASYDPQSEVIVRTPEQEEQWTLDYNTHLWFSRDPMDEGFYKRSVSYRVDDFAEAFRYNSDTSKWKVNASMGYTPVAMNDFNFENADWETNLEEVVHKVIMGAATPEELQAFLDDLHGRGFAAVEAEMQAYLDAL